MGRPLSCKTGRRAPQSFLEIVSRSFVQTSLLCGSNLYKVYHPRFWPRRSAGQIRTRDFGRDEPLNEFAPAERTHKKKAARAGAIIFSRHEPQRITYMDNLNNDLFRVHLRVDAAGSGCSIRKDYVMQQAETSVPLRNWSVGMRFLPAGCTSKRRRKPSSVATSRWRRPSVRIAPGESA